MVRQGQAFTTVRQLQPTTAAEEAGLGAFDERCLALAVDCCWCLVEAAVGSHYP